MDLDYQSLGVDPERYANDAAYKHVADTLVRRLGTPMSLEEVLSLAAACLSTPTQDSIEFVRQTVERAYRPLVVHCAPESTCWCGGGADCDGE